MTTSIILTTINARYSHTAFSLRWLYANLGELRKKTVIEEFNLQQRPLEIAEKLLLKKPEIIGFSVYIWNITLITEVIHTIKNIAPEIKIIIGGPEVSYEYENTELFSLADYLICKEGEIAFRELSRKILSGNAPKEKVIIAPLQDLTKLTLPYDTYSLDDIENRLIYVETSRGCPFGCEFCLSSLDKKVRYFPLDNFFNEMEKLIAKGVWQFKFIDRTFNLDKKRVKRILSFFRERWFEGMRLHFEIVPDKLDEEMLELIKDFPAEGLHLEVGIQSLNHECLEAISRTQDNEKALKNIKFIRSETGALIHADLVAGLPNETWDSFAMSFDRLLAVSPHNIQVGILKLLKGAPIARHIDAYKMIYSDIPTYEILQTNTLDFLQIQRIKRFARYFDLYYNSEKFINSMPLLWKTEKSPFDAFMKLSDSLWETTGKTHQISFLRLVKHFYEFLVKAEKDDIETIKASLIKDYYKKPGRNDKLPFLK
ncbi:MAG: DUF4080 domain-containing protein [Alphaproteobacteria bacterium]|nr:DUF4080 domain-containing protein [Alphaproteobacteria bacterium]